MNVSVFTPFRPFWTPSMKFVTTSGVINTFTIKDAHGPIFFPHLYVEIYCYLQKVLKTVTLFNRNYY